MKLARTAFSPAAKTDAAGYEHHHLRGAEEAPGLPKFIARHLPSVSVISYIEALGYPHLPPAERTDLEAFFRNSRMLPLSPPVMEEAVRLKQARKMSLGDSVIAATALVYGFTLVTRNVTDFRWISGLNLHNPLP